jgi:Helix-turn-helix domain
MYGGDDLSPGRTEEETAEILRVKVATLRTWRSSGRGPNYRKSGRTIFYPDEFLREYLEAGNRKPEAATVRRQRRALAAESATTA